MALLFVGSTIKRAATFPRCTAFISGVPRRGHSVAISRSQNICNTHQHYQNLSVCNTIYDNGMSRCGLFPYAASAQSILCNTFHQYRFSTVQLANTISNNEEHDEEVTTKKQKSRKQRRKITKDLNFQRIDKVLAHRGVGTRKATFQLAKSKRITISDSPDSPYEERERILSPKQKVPFAANLFLDGTLLPGPPPLLLVYHKPKNVLSTMEDDKKYADQQRKHLGQVLDDKYKAAGIHPVGRLDYDTTGLILFSLDGQLTQALLHPKRGIEKEYLATVQGDVNETDLKKKLSEGVKTTEGVHKAKLLSVSPSDGPDFDNDKDDNELEELLIQSNIMQSEEGNGDEDDDNDDGEMEMIEDFTGTYSDVKLTVKEGKYRMVRRILANCGHPVVALQRLRHGNVELGGLKVGELRHVTEDEISWAKTLIK